MRNLQRAIFSSVVASLVVSVGACGGSGGSGGGGPTVATSKFIDSAVEGLTFNTTSGLTGLTARDGSFQHNPSGEIVTFSVGGVTLGTTGVGGGIIVTPVELAGYSNFTSAVILNRVRFLMMLDSDRNPSNGITISSAVRTVAASWPAINFSAVNLDTDPNIASILNDVATADGQPAALPTISTAQNHIFATYACSRTGLYLGSWSSTSLAGRSGNNAMIFDHLGNVTLVFTDPSWYVTAWLTGSTTMSSPDGVSFFRPASPLSTSASVYNQTFDSTYRFTASTNFLSTLPSMGDGNYSYTSVVVNLPNGTVGVVYQGTAVGNLTLIAFKMAINGTSITGVATGANMPAMSLSGTASGGLLNGTIYIGGSVVGSFSAAIQSDGSIAGSFNTGADSGALSACRAP